RPTLPKPTPMAEGWQRQRFHEALARAIFCAPQPLLLILDDLQWVDGETVGWLRYLLRFDPQAPLLIVATVRTEAVETGHPLLEQIRQLQRAGHYRGLELAPLNEEETTVLAGHLSDEDVQPWAARLYAETEGNPLFVVETMRAGLLSHLQEGRVGQPLVP